MNNLTKWVDELPETDLKYLYTVMRRANVEVEIGTVLFLDRDVVITALQWEMRDNNGTMRGRQAKRMIDKIMADQKSITEFIMFLDDMKVFKKSSGDGPCNRLMRMGMSKVVGAGLRWDAFKRAWVKPETTVQYQIVLTRLKPGVWKCKAETRVCEALRNILFEKCGGTPVSSKHKARRR